MIKKIFVTGLTAIIPLVLTCYLIAGLFHFADGILGKFINKFLSKYIGYQIPGLGILIAVLIIFFVGALIRISRMKVHKWMEGVFFRIPLVNKIYLPIRKIVDFLFFPPQKSFRSAVLVEYPRKGIYSLGFVTNENSIEFKEKGKRKLYSIFMPSSPYPLTGFTIIVDEKELVILDIGVEEALRLVVSGGLINPQD
ncbi:MAG: DUF502 domain-containing protein [Candidatus Omnitrophica bacterium]|nr:DUF502 domain-containing protein [Candidatus Omnitrophota bacterium]MCK5393350.1 DUF502 domain-containing protein [Candidatus Omnitrophota bacterium]